MRIRGILTLGLLSLLNTGCEQETVIENPDTDSSFAEVRDSEDTSSDYQHERVESCDLGEIYAYGASTCEEGRSMIEEWCVGLLDSSNQFDATMLHRLTSDNCDSRVNEGSATQRGIQSTFDCIYDACRREICRRQLGFEPMDVSSRLVTCGDYIDY